MAKEDDGALKPWGVGVRFPHIEDFFSLFCRTHVIPCMAPVKKMGGGDIDKGTTGWTQV